MASELSCKKMAPISYLLAFVYKYMYPQKKNHRQVVNTVQSVPKTTSNQMQLGSSGYQFIEQYLWVYLMHVEEGRLLTAFFVTHRIASAWMILFPNLIFFILNDVNKFWARNHASCETHVVHEVRIKANNSPSNCHMIWGKLNHCMS